MTIRRDRSAPFRYCHRFIFAPIDRTQRLLALIAENVAAGKPDLKRAFKF
jgi:hypothetical protein